MANQFREREEQEGAERCSTCEGNGYFVDERTDTDEVHPCPDCTDEEDRATYDERDLKPDTRRRVRCAVCGVRFIVPGHCEVFGDEWCIGCCGITPEQARAAAFDQRRRAMCRSAA